MSFLSDFEVAVTAKFLAVVGPISDSVLAAFRPVFAAGFAIWIMLIAYDVIWGKTDDGITYILTKIGKMALIGTFALYGWGAFWDFADAIRSLLLASIANASGPAATCSNAAGTSSMSCVLETNLLDPLAQVWAALWASAIDTLATFSATSLLLSTSGVTSLLMVIANLFLYMVLAAVVIVLAVVTMVMYMVSFASFQLLMTLGPFFVMCLAFPVVQRFFENWTGAVMTTALAMSLSAVLAVFASSALPLPTLVGEATSADLSTYGFLLSCGSSTAFGLLVIYMYYKVFDLAAALGGGMNVGNNLLGATRNIMRDAMRTTGQSGRQPGRGNGISTGRARSGGGSPGAGGGTRTSYQAALGRNHTFTGMAMTTAGYGARNGLRAGSRVAGAAVAGASRLGAYAYNRGAAMWRGGRG